MKAQIKKIAALFLSLCVALSMMTVASFAAETTETTISFANTTQRESQTTAKQVWKNGDVTFTNNKGSSTSNVANYSNPVRLYKSSQVIIECENMTKIVFDANSSTYANELNTSIGTVDNATVTVSSDKVTVTFANSANSFTIDELSAQVRLDSITVTTVKEVVACEHTNTTTATTPATETELSKETVTCDDCGTIISSKEIGAKVTYNVLGTQIGSEENVPEATFPTPSALPDAYVDEYTFVGWAKSEINATTTVPTLYVGDKAPIEGNTNFYAVYTYSSKGQAFTYEEKDISDIKATDVVVVTMTAQDGTVYALDNDNGTGSAPTAEVITMADGTIVSAVADNLKWNVGGDAENGYTFYPNGVTNKWLYCTSSNNGVRVGTNTNKVFTIDATSGYLKHTATERFVGVYLDNPDWRCYTSINDNIKNQTLGFYVESVSEGIVTYYTTDLAIKGASIDAGADLTVNFYVADEYANGTMTFTMDGETTTVSQTNGAFAFTGIAPDYMTEEITAELTFDGTVVGTFTTTVKEIAEKYLDGNDDKVITFVKNMLHYGAASQNYQGYNTDKLASDGITGNTTAEPVAVDGIGLSASDTKYFRSANVWFANQNHIIVNFQNLPENAKLIVKKGEQVEFEGTAVASYKTAGLKATELDIIYTFVLCDAEGNGLQSLTYSVNHYAFIMKDNANISKLVIALYNYGLSAEPLA